MICTKSKLLWKRLFALADKFLCGRKSRYMSVSSNLLMTEERIFSAVKKQSAAIVIIDVQAFENWQEIALQIEALSRSVRICLVSGTAEAAVEAINSLGTVCGYICRQYLEKMFTEIFSRLYGKIRTVCGGLMITHYSSVDKVIPFEDILFIETVKQTHMCNVVHKNGTDEIRYSISDLINELPDMFMAVRSSAIANISEVKRFSENELFFGNGVSCQCGRKYASKIIPFMQQTAMS